MTPLKQALAALLVLTAVSQSNALELTRWGDRGDRGNDHWREDRRRVPPPHRHPAPPHRPPPHRPLPPPPPPHRPPPPPPYYGDMIEVPMYVYRNYIGFNDIDLYYQMNLYRYHGYRLVSVEVLASSEHGYGTAELFIDGWSHGMLTLPTYISNHVFYPNRWEYIGNDMSSARLSLRGNINVQQIVVRLRR